MVNTTSQSLALTSYTPDIDGHVVTMSYSTLPTFAVFDSATKTFTFTPVLTSEIGVNTFVITLSDTNAPTSYTITINVLNNPPVYDSPVPPAPIYQSLTIPLNSVKSIVVPPFHDPDGSDCYVYIY